MSNHTIKTDVSVSLTAEPRSHAKLTGLSLPVKHTELPIFTSRSKIETAHKCPRRRFWEYEFTPVESLEDFDMPHIRGIKGLKPSIDLSVGSAVHKGLEAVMDKVAKSGHAEFITDDWYATHIIPAAMAEFDTYWQPWLEKLDGLPAFVVREWMVDEDDSTEEGLGGNLGGGNYSGGGDGSKTPDISYQMSEAKALIEALLWVWKYVGLRQFTDNYDVIAVEAETMFEIAPGVYLSTRPDMIVQHRVYKTYHSADFKTAGKFDDRSNNQAAIDNQGLVQAMAVKALTGKDSMGELRIILVKGSKHKDPLSGDRKITNGLIRPFELKNAMSMGLDALVPTMSWECVEPHEFKGAKGGFKMPNGKTGCPGGKSHRRAQDDYRQVNIWEVAAREEEVSIREWVKLVCETYPEYAAGMVKFPDAVQRTAEEINEFLVQTIHGEVRIANASTHLAEAPDVKQRNSFQRDFPQHRSNCTYPYGCSYYRLCHKGEGDLLLDLNSTGELGVDMLANYNWQPNTPNHPETLNEIEVIKWPTRY